MEYKVKGRVQRGIRMAYVNTMAKGSTKNGGIWPFDTGTLKHSFRMTINGEVYTLKFDEDMMNPKSKKKLRNYIDFIHGGHNEDWWKKVCENFMSELQKITGGKLEKK